MLCRCARYEAGGPGVCGACTEFDYSPGVVSTLVRDLLHENCIQGIDNHASIFQAFHGAEFDSVWDDSCVL
jgi:hypothetical protein